jgi:TP901 family phage tail tape measure protein
MASSMARSAVPIRQMGDAMRQTGSLIKYAVIGGLVNLGTASMQASRQFEISMKQIQGLVGISANAVQGFKDEILKMGAATSKGPAELADALYFITSAGLKGRLALDVLNQSARAAAAGLGETKVVADALTSAINAYGPGVYTAAQATDILVATVREGKAEADQFAPALGKVLPVAAAFGATFEDVSAGVAALTRTGASAGTSAIYLRQVLSQLLKPSKQARETLLSFGTSAEQLRTNIQEDGLLSALEGLNISMGSQNGEIMATELTKVFGNVRALTAVFSLLGPNLEANREIFAKMSMTAGDADAAFAAYAETSDYKFKKALAEGQAAMVRFGDAIMPAATMLISLGGALSRVAETILRFATGTGIIGRFGKSLFIAGAMTMIMSKGLLFLFLRAASFIRIMGHGQVVMRGFFTGLRGGTTGIRTLGAAFKKTNIQLVSHAEAQSLATAAGTGNLVSEKALLTAMAAKNTGTAAGTQLTKMAAGASVTKMIATDAETVATYGAAAATRSLGAAMVAVIGPVLMIASLVYTLASSFGLIGGMGDGFESSGQNLDKLNETLGVTAHYAKTGLNVDVTVTNTTVDKGSEEDKKNTKEGIDEALDNAKTVLESVKGKDMGLKIDVGAAILAQMDFGKGADAEKAKAKFAQSIGDVIGGGAEDSDQVQAMIKQSEASGAAIAGALTLGVLTKKQYKWGPDIQPDFSALAKTGTATADAIFKGLDKSTPAVATQAVGQMGEQLAAQFDRSQNYGGVVLGIKEIGKASKGTSLEATAGVDALKSSFDNISETSSTINFEDTDLGIKQMLSNKGNLDGFVEVFGTMGMDVPEATFAVKELNEIMAANPSATAAEQVALYTKYIEDHVGGTDAATAAQKEFNDATYEAATVFKNGLNPEVQEAVDTYSALNAAIDNYKKGQEALKGPSTDFIQAQIDANEAAKDFGVQLAKSGGKVGVVGESGESYNKLIKLRDETLNVANIQAASGDTGAAAQYIATQYAQALDALVKGGANLATAQKQLADIGFNPTELVATFTGADQGAGGEPIGTNIAEGIKTGLEVGLGTGKSPGVDKYNQELLAEFQSAWGIKSPSKVAETQIGKWIGEGILGGIVSTVSGDGATDVSKTLISSLRKALGIKSKSKAMEAEVGRWAGMGLAYGITSQVAAIKTGDMLPPIGPIITATGPIGGKIGDSIGKNMAGRITWHFNKVFKAKGPISASAAAKFMKSKDDVKTDVKDLIERVGSEAMEALGTIGSYLDAQLGFRKALADNIKLANTQLGLQAELNKATRAQATILRKKGSGMGTSVTDYEASQIEELEKAYEKVSRDYAMRKATYTDLIDAEDALNEARSAASEVAPESISAENSLIDAQEALKDKSLEAAKAIYNVVDAQGKLNNAAIDFKINGDLAKAVFDNFANQAFPNMDYRINTTTGVIEKAGIALSDDGGVFVKSLQGLGTKIYNSINVAIAEAVNASVLPEFFKKLFNGGGVAPLPVVPDPKPAAAPTGNGGSSGGGSSGGGSSSGSSGGSSGGSTGTTAPSGPSQAALDAESARLQAQADAYAAQEKARQAAIAAESARLTAQAKATPVPTVTALVKTGVDPSVAAAAVRAQAAAKAAAEAKAKADAIAAAARADAAKAAARGGGGGATGIKYRAAGGPVMRSMPYIVGEKGPELFTPRTSGRISTTTALQRLTRQQRSSQNASPGKNYQYNITVNNPIPEKASDSISRRMKAMSTSGQFG